LRGSVAKTDILPGQQLTVSDFTKASGGVVSELAGIQRAITISIDAAHGMIGQISQGDRVDIYAGFNVNPVDSSGRPSGQQRAVLKLIMQNIPVLIVGTGNRASQVTLKATAYQAEQLAFASDNGRIWLVLRPPTGARASKPNLVTVETLLLGTPPLAVLHSLGGKQ
jgi:Flp pilus assembly protein CpaB